MEKLKLGIFDIFKSEEELFLSNGDHFLLKISGEDCLSLELMLKAFTDAMDKDAAYEKVKDALEREKFDNLVTWLVKNNILYEENQQNKPDVKNHNVIVFGEFKDLSEVESKIVSRLNTDINKYHLKALLNSDIKENCFEGVDLIIIFAPIFSKFDAFIEINKISYEHKIPAIHVGAGMNFFSIGPLSVASSKTPCLKCYSKRKIANFDRKEKYLKFIKYPNQKIVQNNNILEYYDLGLLVEFLKIELENYYSRNSMYLFARSITIDLLGYNITSSKILRVPSCDICDNSSIISPLN